MFESLSLMTGIDGLIVVFNYFKNSIKVLQDFLVQYAVLLFSDFCGMRYYVW